VLLAETVAVGRWTWQALCLFLLAAIGSNVHSMCDCVLVWIGETEPLNVVLSGWTREWVTCSLLWLQWACEWLTLAKTCNRYHVSKKDALRGGADKSLARSNSRCLRTGSIVSEVGVCSCVELQAFSCHRGWEEACQATRAISTTKRWVLWGFLFFLQGKATKEIHVILTEALREHALSYATVKNWVAQFKRGDFSTCDAPRPGRPKTVTNREIIDQIHELILEDRRISSKLIAEQLGISRCGLGPSFMKIWTCGSSPPSGFQNAWNRMNNVNDASSVSLFGATRMVSCPDWLSRTKPGYVTMTRR